MDRDSALGLVRERVDITTCRELGIEMDEFLELGLKAIQEVSDELGL